jgi:ATP-binding cassette subfamily B protein
MKNIFKIIRIAKPLRGMFIFITGFVVVVSLIELLSPVIFKFAIDEVTQKIKNPSHPIDNLLWILAAGFSISMVGQLLTNISSHLGDRYAAKLKKYLTEVFYEKSLSLSQSYYDTELSGKIINQLNRGVQSISDFFNTATNFILTAFLQAVFTIFVLARYSIWTALFVTALFPIYVYLTTLSTKKWGEYQEQRNKLEDTSRGRLSETITNIRLVKGFNSQSAEVSFIKNIFVSINDLVRKQSIIFHKYDFLRNTSLFIILLIINFITFSDAYRQIITIGEAVLIIQLINQVRRPLFAMSFILARIQEAESGSKEFFKILDLPIHEPLQAGHVPQIIKDPSLHFKKVYFNYETTANVLSDVSFDIGQKETVALVGRSGAGKSTLVNLIMKFYNPTKGSVHMGKSDYKKLSHLDVRHNIALVFQENELFSTSIADNVSYGSTRDDARITKALEMAQALDFVMKLPKGIDSEVGERGVRLSGGQKQRIQIARAIYKDAPILILDEATSSLDAQSELAVQAALDTLMKDRLTIIIAHRFSTLRDADRIIVLDEGKVVDQGTPSELTQRPSIYSDLLRFQMEGNKKLLESYEIF